MQGEFLNKVKVRLNHRNTETVYCQGQLPRHRLSLILDLVMLLTAILWC